MGMEDGCCAVNVMPPGDECVGFHTSVGIEGFLVITEIELLLVPPVDASPSWIFRMHESKLIQKL
jgi:hypothetical protein